MNEKKADNTIVDKKVEINKIDNEIDFQKEALKSLNNLKEGFVNLNKDFDKIFNLLSYSVKGKKTSAKLDEMSNSNLKMLNNITEVIDNEKEQINDWLEKLDIQKEKIQKEKRDE